MLAERLVAAIGPRSPWDARRGLRSVAAEPFIIVARARSASFYDHVLSVCAAAGFAPTIVQEANELFTVLSLVRAGLGVSLVPRSAALMRLPGVRFRELTLPEAAWNIALAWHRDSDRVPLVRRFVEMVPTLRGTVAGRPVRGRARKKRRPSAFARSASADRRSLGGGWSGLHAWQSTGPASPLTGGFPPVTRRLRRSSDSASGGPGQTVFSGA